MHPASGIDRHASLPFDNKIEFLAEPSCDIEPIAKLSVDHLATDDIDINCKFSTTFKPSSALFMVEGDPSCAQQTEPESKTKTIGTKGSERTTSCFKISNEDFVCPLKSALLKLEELYTYVEEEQKPRKHTSVKEERLMPPTFESDAERNKFRVRFARTKVMHTCNWSKREAKWAIKESRRSMCVSKTTLRRRECLKSRKTVLMSKCKVGIKLLFLTVLSILMIILQSNIERFQAKTRRGLKKHFKKWLRSISCTHRI